MQAYTQFVTQSTAFTDDPILTADLILTPDSPADNNGNYRIHRDFRRCEGIYQYIWNVIAAELPTPNSTILRLDIILPDVEGEFAILLNFYECRGFAEICINCSHDGIFEEFIVGVRNMQIDDYRPSRPDQRVLFCPHCPESF